MSPATLATWLPAAWAIAIPLAASIPLGLAMARLLDVPTARAGRGLDAAPMLLCRAIGRRGIVGSTWRRYAVDMLGFNAATFAVAFGLLSLQQHLPLNPDGKGSLGALGVAGSDTGVVFNTAVSFATNCSLQHYAGEQHLSYLSQLGAITWLDLVSAASGLACLLAVARGLRGDADLGDFYVDLTRSLVLVLVPLCLVVASALVASGVPMTGHGAARLRTLDGGEQVIARGPAAALIAAKQLMTVGGGFFGGNSAHPLENPTPWSNLLEVWSILLLPMAAIVLLGAMLRDRAHAVVVYAVMLAFLALGVAAAVWVEASPIAGWSVPPVAAGASLEGKEVRFGPAASATWAAATTATSNGSVDAMHDSFRPLGGLVPLALMLLNVAFSGIGAGFLHMLLYIVVAVFLGGLMVGRTPEYLGKKVEAREVKLAMIGLLLHPLIVCGGAALFAATPWGQATVSIPGPHGFSQILYEFASSAATNGSGFEGLSDNNPPWNIATGVVMLLGRYPALILPLAIAGSLSAKPRLPQTFGTLRTDTTTFAAMLFGTVLLVGALSFLPAAVLGPLAESLSESSTKGGGP